MGATPLEVPRSDYIFLSHAGADTQAARQFAEILRHNGLNIWFDKDHLPPGNQWMATLEDAISGAYAMIVYIGSLGVQAWVDREVRFGLLLNTRNREAFRFIPVLGEGADPAKLPPFVQLHQYVDRRDPEHIRRLVGILRNPSSSQAAVPAEYWTTHSPFRSLQVFSPEDSWLFFGRDRDTDELVTQLGRTPTLAVIGNSGSGKSSLIQAGLIPALLRGRFRHGGNSVDSWRIAVFRPSNEPFDYLSEVLPGKLKQDLSPTDRAKFIEYFKEKLPAGGDALRNAIAALDLGDAHVLLVADQFEELFTLVDDPATRSRYIDSLLAAARPDGAVPVYLVLSLRADFYANCLDYPNLSASIASNLYNVPRMSPPQLRDAIENRLALAATRAEPGLVDSLLADVGDEPGNLALLEHALAKLWEKSGGSGCALTSEGYSEIGRLQGALGRHADEVYRDLGSESDRHLAQRIFLELVQLGEGAPDTRRRVAKGGLLHLGRSEQVERVIAHLASKRLLATSGQGPQSPVENFIEVPHEALIREWPALREWLKDNREDLRLGRLLLQAAEEWRDLRGDSSALMRGARLAQGRDWLARQVTAAAPLREFLDASCNAEEEAVHKEREAQKQKITRARSTVIVAVVVVLSLAVVVWWALSQKGRADRFAQQSRRDEEQALEREQRALEQISIANASFQDLYGRLGRYLNSFNATLNSSWDGSTTHVLFSAALRDLDADMGPQLLDHKVFDSVVLQVLSLKAMGARAVMVEVGFPMLYAPFFTSRSQYQQFVDLYSQVATTVRAMGMKLVVENDTLLPSSDVRAGWKTTPFYGTLNWAQYQQARAQTAVVVAQIMQPDYLVVFEEPKLEANNSGQTNANTPSGATALVAQILNRVRQLGLSRMQVGAGVANYQPNFAAYLRAFVALPLNFIDMHVSRANKGDLLNALEIAKMARAAGLPVTMSQCWLEKLRDSEMGGVTDERSEARNSFSFWEPLDSYFIRSMVKLANYTRMSVLSISGSQYFLANIPYNSSTANLADGQILGMEGQQADLALSSLCLKSFCSGDVSA